VEQATPAFTLDSPAHTYVAVHQQVVLKAAVSVAPLVALPLPVTSNEASDPSNVQAGQQVTLPQNVTAVRVISGWLGNVDVDAGISL
jgi:hypothetical protein